MYRMLLKIWQKYVELSSSVLCRSGWYRRAPFRKAFLIVASDASLETPKISHGSSSFSILHAIQTIDPPSERPRKIRSMGKQRQYGDGGRRSNNSDFRVCSLYSMRCYVHKPPGVKGAYTSEWISFSHNSYNRLSCWWWPNLHATDLRKDRTYRSDGIICIYCMYPYVYASPTWHTYHIIWDVSYRW